MKFLSYTYPGLEWILKNELEKRKIKVNEIGPGFVKFVWDETALIKANLWLRTANKVYILLSEKEVFTFDDIFNVVYNIDWKRYLSDDFSFSLKIKLKKSKISSVKATQSIIQKAIIKKLVDGKQYDFSKKSLEIRVDIFSNKMKVMLDTSWDPLYKRWYKIWNSDASLKETLAAWLCLLLNYSKNKFYDPFCWSWTILIEKALIDLNIAPGSFRKFIFEEFDWIDKKLVEKERWRASTRIKDRKFNFFGFDIDDNVIAIAKENVKSAGLDKMIKIEKKDYLNLKDKLDFFITNPPYGKRINSQVIDKIYKKLFFDLNKADCGWIITWYKDIDKKWFDTFKVRTLSNGGQLVKFFYKK